MNHGTPRNSSVFRPVWGGSGTGAHHWTTLSGEGGPTPRRYAVDTLFVLFYLYAEGIVAGRLLGLGRLDNDPWAWVGLVPFLAVLGGVILRWKWPLPAFVVVTAAHTIALVGWSAAPYLAAAWVLYPVALTARPVSLRSGSLLVFGLLVLTWVVTRTLWDVTGAPTVFPMLALLSPFVVSWLLGRLVRAGHLQRQRESEAALAAARSAERLRVAREVHDVVSHALGAIGMRAGVARYVSGDDPQALRSALADIETTGRAAADELRLLLGTLRAHGDVPLAPQPGLPELSGIAGTARAAGVECTVRVHGADDLPETVALGVHRVVQESVTNAIRHAPGTTCTVTVNGGRNEVVVEVSDTGPAGDAGCPPEPGSGAGQAGMRERVDLLGGTLTAGPRPDGGYRVHARIPFDRGDSDG
ncbi:sensor histidine kinase [Nocardiopsis oceani]